ncbi:MAG: hypothetical protein ACRD33_04845, partial [Candidatus Acidiferrales bacterium]
FAALPTLKWWAVDILNWVAIPGIALLIGVVPFLRSSGSRDRDLPRCTMPDGFPDWRKEAARRLADAKFSAAEREEVSRELSGYLEDLCDDARRSGLGESSAVERASAELDEDKKLGANLRRARKENNMNDRTKRLWLPGITMLLATIALLTIFQVPGLSHPAYGTLWLRGGAAHWREFFWRIYGSRNIAWLCILAIFSAAGAYWSRRAGSGRGTQAVVGLSPLLVFIPMFAVMVYFNFALDAIPPAKALVPALAVDTLKWVVIPGIALLLGVLPFLRSADSRRHAL